MDLEDMLTTAQVAELAGVKTGSIRRYRVRNRERESETIPEPDAYIGATPLWRRETITAWLETRPGEGRPRNTGAQESPPSEPTCQHKRVKVLGYMTTCEECGKRLR